MSPKRTIPKLSYLSLKTLENLLIHTLSDDSFKNFDSICDYMVSATYDTLQSLLKEILSNIVLDASTRVNCLGVLLREDVQKLEVGIFPRFYYEQILEIIADRGKRLQHLNLKGVWVKDYPHLLNKMIESCPNLRTLIIPHMADDTVLETIVTHLKKVTFLDICGEACYTQEGIQNFNSDLLKVLDIGTFGKKNLIQDDTAGVDTISVLLKNLPNLVSLKTYSFTGHALFNLYKNSPQWRTKLSYFHDTKTTMESMETIVEMCPDLENVHLDSPEKGVVLELKNFKKLHSLKLSKVDLEELSTFLRNSNDQIQVLKLNHSKATSLDLSAICLATPNLHRMELFHMRPIFTNLETYFVNLESVEILYCEISDSTVKFFMTNAPFLKKIVIGCVINMTDGDIFRMCAETPFTNLEELRLSYARSLTITSAELLMGHCPNLKILGQLSGWDVSQEELDYLRAVILATNTDLRLLVL